MNPASGTSPTPPNTPHSVDQAAPKQKKPGRLTRLYHALTGKSRTTANPSLQPPLTDRVKKPLEENNVTTTTTSTESSSRTTTQKVETDHSDQTNNSTEATNAQSDTTAEIIAIDDGRPSVEIVTDVIGRRSLELLTL